MPMTHSPTIDKKDKISVTIEPEMNRDQQVSNELAKHFRNELNEVKKKHAVKGMKK